MAYRREYLEREREIYRTPASFLETKIPYGDSSNEEYMKRLAPQDDFPRKTKYSNRSERLY